MDIAKYRAGHREQERINDLIGILPKGYLSALDIGARDGYISNLLVPFFETVTALDLEKPTISDERITAVKGDVTHLGFPDNSFDVVLCTEVLEHIPTERLVKACSEISRVAKYNVVIGVPYNQDTRVGQTTCLSCGKRNPCWGHVNIFNEDRLKKLFNTLTPLQSSFIGEKRLKTNAISVFLMDLAGNPWGTYYQEESCIYCGNKLFPPSYQNIFQKICSRFAFHLNEIQKHFTFPIPNWIHMVFAK